MEKITLERPVVDVPRWAKLERELIRVMSGAIEPIIDEYVDDSGRLLWPPSEDYRGIDGLDDAYESFFNWPLFYLLGGDEQVYDVARREFDVITDQFTEYDTGHGHPIVVNGYEQGYDWFHQSEGYLLFYFLGMANPQDEELKEKASQFANYYLNDAEGVPDLYDEEYCLLKSPMLGSRGPAARNFSERTPSAMYGAHAESRIPWEYADWKEEYGLPFHDLDDIWTVSDLRADVNARRMGFALQNRCANGDVPQNLAATTLVLNAYLHTGEEKYREWVTEYVEAWMSRAKRNGGIVPDNVGPSGVVGECIDGKWYGGYYGWTWPHGLRNIGRAVVAAALNAHLLQRGEERYLEFPRELIEQLRERAKIRDETIYVPFKHGDEGTYDYGAEWNTGAALRDEDGEILWDDGWFEFKPLDAKDLNYLSHIWHASFDPHDYDRIDELSDWCETDGLSQAVGKGFAGHDREWLAYLNGEFHEYPERILEFNIDQVYRRLALMDRDDQDPETYEDNYLHDRNPVTVEGLVHCTLGAPHTIHNGGIQHATLRHFDPERRRPGLPPDVAVLVTKVTSDNVVARVVNTGACERALITQAGGFGEHRFTDLSVDSERTVAVNDRAVWITLQGDATAEIRFGIDPFADTPSYAFPWHREWRE